LTELPTLSIRNLQTSIVRANGVLRVLQGVDLEIGRGETLALVGESGSGKSLTSLSILRLLPSVARIDCGSILFRQRDGVQADLATLSPRAMRRLRGDQIAMIFQEPMTSLNPVRTIGDQIAESLRLHRGAGRREARRLAIEALRRVEIADAPRRVDDYPHQLSGGMRQRVMIAMALSCNPSLLIADEPTTALDVTVQAQILDLLHRLQAEFGISILFVTHNFGVVAETADRVAVLYAGKIVEQAPVRQLFARPAHPYTRALLASLPGNRRRGDPANRLQPLPGAMSVSALEATGCAFAPRCALSTEVCALPPPLIDLDAEHRTRCHHWGSA
jgi:peptide/nickel transport system ATP-binding protein